ILERWDDERVIVVLCFNGHNVLIRNEENPYGKIPFFSFNWRNIPDCFYGQGLGLLIGSEQIVEQGVTNLALDLLNYGLQPTAVRKKGFNTLTQKKTWTRLSSSLKCRVFQAKHGSLSQRPRAQGLPLQEPTNRLSKVPEPQASRPPVCVQARVRQPLYRLMLHA